MSATRSILGLVVALGVCFGAGALGGAFTSRSVATWYTELSKPAWTPPNWLFGPVWSALYFAMAVAAWLVWRRTGSAPTVLPLSLFGLQLAFNVGWSGLFFGLRMPGPAFAEIAVLWCLIGATAITFWRVSVPGALLMLPYLAWVGFAAVLNFSIWRMNA